MFNTSSQLMLLLQTDEKDDAAVSCRIHGWIFEIAISNRKIQKDLSVIV